MFSHDAGQALNLGPQSAKQPRGKTVASIFWMLFCVCTSHCASCFWQEEEEGITLKVKLKVTAQPWANVRILRAIKVGWARL